MSRTRGDLSMVLAVLQFADGLFPAGAFAHSFGLETYVQRDVIRDRAGLEAFLVAQLEGSAGPSDAVAVAAAVRQARGRDLGSVVDLDRRLDAMKCVPEFSAASRQMGRQTARVAAAIDPDAFVRDVAAAVEAGAMPGHHAVVFGAAIGRTGVAAGEAAAAFLYSVSASLVGAALRLLSLGQLDGQRVLAGLRPLIARLAVRAAASEPDDMWSFVPGLEIAGIRHARLTTRLFRS